MPTNQICFFVTPIGSEDSLERKRADQIQRHILGPVLKGDFRVIRADELAEPGSITHQIFKLLNEADLVVADLTGSNPNVIYELAIRHAFNKVSIHLVDHKYVLPFDLKDERTIHFNLGDPDSLAHCKTSIKKFIDQIQDEKYKYHSPVYRALGIAASSEEERATFLKEISEQIDTIATDVSSIEMTLTMSDLDELSGVVRTINALEKNQYDMTNVVRDVRTDISKILNKLK